MKKLVQRAAAWPVAIVIAFVAIGITTAVAVAATSSAPGPTEIMPGTGPDGAVVDRNVPGVNQSPAHLPTTAAPRPDGLTVAAPGAELGTHFSGLNFFDQRRGADGGNQLSLEPPDQGLCIGNGMVIEPINDVMATYDATTGAKTSGNESLNNFFIGDHQIDRTGTAPVFGEFLSDPRCVYDAATNRFFLSILAFARDPASGAFEGPASIRLATSKTGTPTTSPSDWNFTVIDNTNDGTVSGEQTHPTCPCFGDQPLIGIDQYGVYFSTNEFPINGPGFNGAQIYAVQKSALVAGTPPNIVRIEGAPIASTGYGGGFPYSLQPTTSPSAADFATGANGTEYLVGALEFSKQPFQLDNRIAVWALTNTASLDTTPNLHISDAVISSQVYGFPPAIVQPNGPTPLGDAVKNHENLIDGGDDRMQAAVYAHGHLWAAGDTTVKTQNRGVQVGITYYMINPSVANPLAVSASVAKQGYVSVTGNSVTRPSLGVTSSGKVVLGGTLVGPDYFPSAAYTTFDDSPSSAPTTLHVAAAGTTPADGFTGYPAEQPGLNNGIERWGDYAYAAADGNNIWIANEWIQGNVAFPPNLANWNTFVSKVTP